MIETDNSQKPAEAAATATEKKASGGKKNKAVTGGAKNKGAGQPKADKPEPVAGDKPAKEPPKKVVKAPPKKATKKAAKKEPAKKAAKKAAKKEPTKKAAKKAGKPKAAAAKGVKIEGNPYRPGTAFFQVFERLRANPKKKLDLQTLFKGVDFPDQSRMLAHMRNHGESGERGLKFKLDRVEGGFIIYTPR